MGLARFRAAVEDVDPLGGLLATVRLGTGETAVTGRHLSETTLAPAELGSTLLLDALHGVKGVLARRGAVTLDLTRHLHHAHHLSVSPTGVGYLAMTHRETRRGGAVWPDLRGGFLSPTLRSPHMESTLAAALLLWLPALLAVFGGFNLVGRGGAMWRVLTPMSVLLVAVAPLTVPDSTSTQAVELLWGVAVVGLPLVSGLALLVFTGDVPVGRVPAWGRPAGVILVALSAWLIVAWTPTFVDDATLWSRFVVVLLAATASLCAALFVVHRFYVPRRRSRSWPMLAGAICASGLLVLRGVDGSIGALVVAEVAGLFLGAGFALLLSMLVIWLFERNLPEPDALPPPSEEDLERAAAIIARRVTHGGDAHA